jgi:acylphosphatase
MKTCIRCIVKGKVHGVFFRANTRVQAEQLDITGSARNLPDGTVEVVACGEIEAIEKLRTWLRHGPPEAEVSGIASEVIAVQDFPGFTTG